MVERVQQLNKQFNANKNSTFNGGVKDAPKRDSYVVIIGMARTAMTRAKRGPQRDTGTEAMLKPVLEAVAKQSGIDKAMVEDIVIGNVLQSGAGSTNARMAGFLAGYPETTTVQCINRLCSSGLQAVATIANAIASGEIGMGIGGGVETMSNGNMMDAVNPNLLSEQVFENELAQNCLMPMGITSENVAKQFGVDRATQDAMAVESHRKAANAQKQGWAQSEITPYKTFVKDDKGEQQEVLVDKDDGVRANTTIEGLAKLKPAFDKKAGTTTAGNSS